jgi:hypothetical protein
MSGVTLSCKNYRPVFDEAGSRTQEMRCIYLELDFRAAALCDWYEQWSDCNINCITVIWKYWLFTVSCGKLKPGMLVMWEIEICHCNLILMIGTHWESYSWCVGSIWKAISDVWDPLWKLPLTCGTYWKSYNWRVGPVWTMPVWHVGPTLN